MSDEQIEEIADNPEVKQRRERVNLPIKIKI